MQHYQMCLLLMLVTSLEYWVLGSDLPRLRRRDSSSGLFGVMARGPLGRRVGTPKAAFKLRFSGLGLLE
jgi:hypothetical protein